jgi:D-sedoheptulose 7-phosphate isomerase
MDEIIRQYIDQAAEALRQMDDKRLGEIRAAAAVLIDCLRSGGAVFVCGNGGSAADAQHIAAELAGRFLRDRPALNCSALSTNTSNLTAIGNDYGYDRVFARQVEAHARKGDALWVLSTSGNSANIMEAVRIAREMGVKIVSFTGRSGGKLAAVSDVCFKAPAETSAAIQQVHEVAYHSVCDIIERQAEELARMRDER